MIKKLGFLSLIVFTLTGCSNSEETSQEAEQIENEEVKAESYTFNPGTYIVGQDIPPGWYWITADTDKEDDSFGFLGSSTMGITLTTTENSTNKISNSHFYLTPGTTIIIEDDAGITEAHFEEIAFNSEEPSTELSAGIWQVGVHIPAGTYTVTRNGEPAGPDDFDPTLNVLYPSGQPIAVVPINSEPYEITLEENQLISVEGPDNFIFEKVE